MHATQDLCTPATLAPARDMTIEAVAATLDQLAEVLAAMDQSQYLQSPVGDVHSAIGPHVRHTLDHVAAWLASLESGRLDFDHRDRGTPIETDLSVARITLDELIQRVRDVPAGWLARRLTMKAMPTADGPAVRLTTTALRELLFVLSHTIHHYALIGVMARTLGVPTPPRFGYAPSTIAHLQHATQSCAR